MDKLDKKARNFFIIAKISEKLGMLSESASNYFKSLSAVNDYMLSKAGLRAKDHSERFLLLKINFPELYEITDKLFTTYRRTYTEELKKEELSHLRKNVEEAFEHAGISIPTDEELKKKTEELS